MVNDVLIYSPDAGLMNQNIPRGQLQIGDLVAAIYTITPCGERALVELACADDYVPDLVGNSHASVEVMTSFVSNVNKFLLGPAEEDWCNQEFFTEMVCMFSGTGYKLEHSSK